MAKPDDLTVVTTQRDFSAGEVDPEAKRDDTNPIVKAGLRQASNGRILNSKGWQNRSGRRVIGREVGRVEKIQLGTSTFYICFGIGTLKIYTSNFSTLLFSEAGRPWNSLLGNTKDVVYAILDRNIYICFPGVVTRVLTWDGSLGFAAANYAESITRGNQKRTFFYRLSPKGVTLQPSATTGFINITFSSGMNLTASHIGTRMRFCGRQILINGVSSLTTGTANVQEALPPGQILTFPVGIDPATLFAIDDVAIGSVSGATGIVTNINSGARTITVQLLSSNAVVAAPRTDSPVTSIVTTGFTTADTVASAGGSSTITAVATTVPQAVTIWDDEVINNLRGFPASCFVDQGRLGFCNFPQLPRAIGWSAFGLPNDLYVDATVATAAILELAPENAQVFHVVPGPDGSEFAFCSNAIWRIPISATNPLKPGSVGFEPVSRDGCASVQPRPAFEHIFFMSSGQTRMMAVEPTGYATHPFSTRDLSELRTHLFSSPVAIAIPTGDGTFPERYIYVLNSNGTLAVGKFSTVDGKVHVAGITGWLPWSGRGPSSWVAALGAEVTFTTDYTQIGATSSVVELLDDTRYLDGSQLYNSQPVGLPIPVGKGPLWWMPGGAVDVMDGTSGRRMMGTYIVDADGFLVPQGNAGENFASGDLIVGQAWNATIEPFIPAVQNGQDVGQRMWPRRMQRAQIYVKNSTGFVMQRIYGDQSGPNLPAAGTVMKQRRITTWNQGEDPTTEPTLREQSYLDRPLGRSHDPRWSVLKDTPGPLTVLEISTQVTV